MNIYFYIVAINVYSIKKLNGCRVRLSGRGGASAADKSVRVVCAGHRRTRAATRRRINCPYHFIVINYYDWLPRNTPDILLRLLINVR